MRAREFAARARHRDERGFTLIELLIVIVILGALAGVVLFAVPRFLDDANLAADLTNLSTLNTASATYAVSAGPGRVFLTCPTTLPA